jgi:hypothetical protein
VTCVTGGGWRRFLAKGCAYVLQLSAFPLMFVRFEAGGLYPWEQSASVPPPNVRKRRGTHFGSLDSALDWLSRDSDQVRKTPCDLDTCCYEDGIVSVWA